jgi:DNA-binding NarL/FixJ family response regulator
MTKIRILLVDDHTMFRSGLRVLLNLYPDFEVVGEAGDGQEALDAVRELAPDIVLMDIAMPGLDGLVATRRIHEEHSQARVILLTQHENREYVTPALKSGAAGYVLKRAADEELVRAVRAVYQGQTYLDPMIASVVVNDYRHRLEDMPADDQYESLTPREREVLVLVAEGHTNREVAELLGISHKTVDYHRTNVMRKLDVHNRTELTRYAIRRGLMS